MNDDELLRYSRHILLSELGIEGQTKLLNSHALIIGAGGLGCAAALYLASSGIGCLTLVDDDRVDLTNLQRQIAHTTARINQTKVSSLANAISQINPQVGLNLIAERATPELLSALLSPGQSVQAVDIVLDCSDNFRTRHAVNAACAAHHIALVSGSALRMDGQLSTFHTGKGDSPCYACLFPPDEEPEEVSCSTMGVFAPLVGIIGAAQASEALKMLCGVGQPLIGKLVMFNASHFKWSEIGFKRNLQCSVCAQHAQSIHAEQ